MKDHIETLVFTIVWTILAVVMILKAIRLCDQSLSICHRIEKAVVIQDDVDDADAIVDVTASDIVLHHVGDDLPLLQTSTSLLSMAFGTERKPTHIWHTVHGNFTIFDSIRREGILACVIGGFDDGGVVWVLSRGVASEFDIWSMLDSDTLPYGDAGTNHGHVHKGTHDVFHDMYSDVAKALNRLVTLRKATSSPPLRFHFVGHSMGASLSALYALRLSHDGGVDVARPIKVIMIGAPRLGCERMSRFCDSQAANVTFIRVVNESDVICHVPTTINDVDVKFAHVGQIGLYFDLRGETAVTSHLVQTYNQVLSLLLNSS